MQESMSLKYEPASEPLQISVNLAEDGHDDVAVLGREVGDDWFICAI